jgi:hypothetical protein
MKSPDQDLQPSGPKTPCNIGGAGKLVGLDADKSDHGPAVRATVGSDDLFDRYFLYCIIQDFDAYFEIVAKNLAAIQIFSEAAETGECVAGQDTSKMADYIALVIVFGWLNQYNRKAFAFDLLCRCLSSHNVKYSHSTTYPETLTMGRIYNYSRRKFAVQLKSAHNNVQNCSYLRMGGASCGNREGMAAGKLQHCSRMPD